MKIKLITIKCIALISAFLILKQYYDKIIDPPNELITASNMTMIDSVSHFGTTPVILEDTIKTKITIVNGIPAKDTTIVKSFKNKTFRITLSIRDTVLSVTPDSIKSFYDK
tara:strand:+ start:47903 stop:48235 length:333 start_codon:yes stop_codon:yes gene_type:complete